MFEHGKMYFSIYFNYFIIYLWANYYLVICIEMQNAIQSTVIVLLSLNLENMGMNHCSIKVCVSVFVAWKMNVFFIDKLHYGNPFLPLALMSIMLSCFVFTS